MTHKQAITTDKAATPGGPYSPAIISNGFVFLSGCTPHRPGPGRELVTTSFRAQAELAFDNLKALAEASGASLADAVRATVYISDWKYFGELNEVFGEYFGEVGPTRTTLPVVMAGFDIEIDAILALPDDAHTDAA